MITLVISHDFKGYQHPGAEMYPEAGKSPAAIFEMVDEMIRKNMAGEDIAVQTYHELFFYRLRRRAVETLAGEAPEGIVLTLNQLSVLVYEEGELRKVIMNEFAEPQKGGPFPAQIFDDSFSELTSIHKLIAKMIRERSGVD